MLVSRTFEIFLYITIVPQITMEHFPHMAPPPVVFCMLTVRHNAYRYNHAPYMSFPPVKGKHPANAPQRLHQRRSLCR